MATSRTDLILHPVRMRLLATLARRQLTSRQLSELLPEIPQATLYHHLNILKRAGLLRVVSERRVRGTVESRYAFADDTMSLSPADMANVSPDDHLRYFTIFVTTLIGEFARYLEQNQPINLFADGAGYRETPFYLSDEEFAQAAAALSQALLPFLSNEPAPNRRRRLLTVITFPDAESLDAKNDTEPPTNAPAE
ncbi:MAG TPA: helix-turn-helix domain-containing protein [Ktedonobacterales bacterium]|nr:helix-turn-helix domain-containing protein [Ktedonobacterales bacterium]